MKLIHCIHLSEDGLWACYSNTKALLNGIYSLPAYKDCRVIDSLDGIEKPLNYANLLKELDKYTIVNITNGGYEGGTIRIESLKLISK